MTRTIRAVAGAAVAAAALLAPVFVGPATANATASTGVSSRTLAHTDIPVGLVPFIPQGAHVEVTETTIAPGGTTGWHYHDGETFAFVRQGTLTHPESDCKPSIYPTGSIFSDPPGKKHVHEGKNVGDVPVVIVFLYVTPPGKPLSQDADAPDCAKAS
ncbi:cupin [Gordonia alkanivorans]|uniref:cupin domain-containing protein n=1 Tax=Gordonia alkanivorans TaxID=84096 RepID=UPI000FDDFF6D|nr:cupin domain-containing protein [Gordonia alkanivorans]AZZ80930.1 cupin [Gordonia alkanivorans]